MTAKKSAKVRHSTVVSRKKPAEKKLADEKGTVREIVGHVGRELRESAEKLGGNRSPSIARSVSEEMQGDEPPPSKRVSKKVPSARCSIVSAAFRGTISGAVRQRLKKDAGLAFVILVPGPSWVAPTKSFFLERYGKHWEVAAPDTAKPNQKAERNAEIAISLSRGHSVVGIAVDRNELPTVLTMATDLTIRLDVTGARIISRAIRMFTGKPVPAGLNDKIGSGLEFHDLVAAFRANSSPAEIVERLLRAAASSGSVGAAERLPKLDDAVEYGAARTWGMALARDIADYRGGHLDWQEVDRGAVLFSEPGLGKSLFARLLARACGVPLVAFSVADLFAGSPGYLDSVIKASRAMFERAAAVAPCILFLDELDALPNRATMSPRGSDWWTPVVTDFLLSLDNAVAGRREGIVVIGATNNIKGVDAAILRPGRLERAIEVKRPNRAGTINILRHHLNGDLPEADVADLAELLDGSTGAEIMMAVRDARRIARYAGRRMRRDDVLEAVAPAEEVAPDALRRVCIHEAAHAVGSIVVPSDILKRCVVRSSGGFAGRTLIKADTNDLLTRDSVERRSIVLLCGRAAEQILIGNVGLGSGGDESSDLAQVTQYVASLHASTGLGETLAYLCSHRDSLKTVRLDPGLRAAVENHIRILQARAEDIVHRHRDAIVAVADQLRTRGQLSAEEVRRTVEATTAKDRNAAAQ